ncbi:MAG: hypothetical protein DRP84_08775 [Spirochaetes bacterium]|nr:MAG: hypothetical protein DRP84_08775 [Spirochaetota bacterium]
MPYVIRSIKSKFSRYFNTYAPFWRNKEVGLYGNFGHGDVGDDASFIAAQDLLDINLMPLSKRCYAFNPSRLKALLIGGGGILRWESPYIPRRILTKKKWNFPVILFSAGLNCDYNKKFTQETEDKIKKLCSVCDYITARDKLSQEFFNSLGFDKVSIMPDLELVLKEKPIDADFRKKGLNVGIVLTPHSEFNSADFKNIVEVFSEFTNYLLDRGNNVIYIPFEQSVSENTKENEMIQEIVKSAKYKDKVKVLEGNYGPKEILLVIKKNCDVMACMRLHSAIFSTNAGIPFFCISYNLTHKGFLEMLDVQDLDIPFFKEFSFEAVKSKFEYILANYDLIKSKLIEKRDYLRGLIYKEAGQIKNFLEKKNNRIVD